MSDEFSILKLIREVYDEAGDLNIHKLVADVDARIRPENRDQALRQSLPTMVHEVVHKLRSDTRMGSQTGAESDDLARKRAARSPKVAGIREYWRQALLAAHSVNRSGDLKRLGDMNRVDLLFNVQAREEAARHNAAKALEFRSLLDLVTRHNAETVGDLPENVLSATLARSA